MSPSRGLITELLESLEGLTFRITTFYHRLVVAGALSYTQLWTSVRVRVGAVSAPLYYLFVLPSGLVDDFLCTCRNWRR